MTDGPILDSRPSELTGLHGFGNAIVGTLVMVGLSTLISVPIGIFAAIYLAILDPASRLG